MYARIHLRESRESHGKSDLMRFFFSVLLRREQAAKRAVNWFEQDGFLRIKRSHGPERACPEVDEPRREEADGDRYAPESCASARLLESRGSRLRATTRSTTDVRGLSLRPKVERALVIPSGIDRIHHRVRAHREFPNVPDGIVCMPRHSLITRSIERDLIWSELRRLPLAMQQWPEVQVTLEPIAQSGALAHPVIPTQRWGTMLKTQQTARQIAIARG